MEAYLQQIQSALSGSYGVAGVAVALLFIAAKVLTTLGHAVDFHDKNFVEKRLNRLKELRANTADTRPLAGYLDNAIDLESFRLAAGISTGLAKMELLIKLTATGRWDRVQIRIISKFLALKETHPKPQVQITTFDKIAALFSLISALYFIFVGIFTLAVSFREPSTAGFIAGLVLFLLSVGFARFLLSDFIGYKLAMHAKTYLQAQEAVLSVKAPEPALHPLVPITIEQAPLF